MENFSSTAVTVRSSSNLNQLLKDTVLYEAEERCAQDTLSSAPPNDGKLYCERVWDGWGCWNYTLAGTRAFIPCPAYIDGFDESLFAYRDCTSDGTWWRSPRNQTWSNYTPCVNVVELGKSQRVLFVYIAGYSLSIVALLVSIATFVIFKRQLHCDRVTIHKHLFTSYVLNGLSWILYYTLAAMDPHVADSNPIWCRGLHVLTQYFIACNFLWMFCEGLYLHTIIVQAFNTGKRILMICCFIGWGFPVVTTVLYTATRSSDAADQKCWLKESKLQWIVSGPIIATLAINLFFLCNIIRVLVTKLRAVNSPDTVQTRKAVRATLILIPLLGLQFILFPIKPSEGSALEEVYLLTVAIVTSLQGLFVAILFCFLNGEVLSAVRRHCRPHSHRNAHRGSSVTGLGQTTVLGSPSRHMSLNSNTTMSMVDYNGGVAIDTMGGPTVYRSPLRNPVMAPQQHRLVNVSSATAAAQSTSDPLLHDIGSQQDDVTNEAVAKFEV